LSIIPSISLRAAGRKQTISCPAKMQRPKRRLKQRRKLSPNAADLKEEDGAKTEAEVPPAAMDSVEVLHREDEELNPIAAKEILLALDVEGVERVLSRIRIFGSIWSHTFARRICCRPVSSSFPRSDAS
jgi:hypothetical protein